MQWPDRTICCDCAMRASRGAVRIPLPTRSSANDCSDRTPCIAGERQQQATGRREPIAPSGDFLVTVPSISQNAGEDADDCRRPLVNSVHQAKHERTHAHEENQVDRKNAGNHFRRDVGQQARETQCPYCRANQRQTPWLRRRNISTAQSDGLLRLVRSGCASEEKTFSQSIEYISDAKRRASQGPVGAMAVAYTFSLGKPPRVRPAAGKR